MPKSSQMPISFVKYHALGNDYIVIDPSKNNNLKLLTPDQIKLICHRNFGIGSDGILWGPSDEKGVLALRIFNPDGSEAEKSGNGIRIFSRYLQEAGYVSDAFNLKTLGGLVKVEFLQDGLIKVDMGRAEFQSDKIPVKGPVREIANEDLLINGKTYKATCVSMGNPHCVLLLSDISEKLAKEIGPSVESHENFPNKINMQLLKVSDKKNIQIEIWERGAGYTLASGSSSCAAASAAYKLGLVDKNLTVHMPGGIIKIDIQDNGHVFMTGPVTRIAEGILDKKFL